MKYLLQYNSQRTIKIKPFNNIIFRCGQVLIKKKLNYNKFCLYIP